MDVEEGEEKEKKGEEEEISPPLIISRSATVSSYEQVSTCLVGYMHVYSSLSLIV